jgi:serine protease Do
MKATVCLELGEGSGSGVIVSADGLILTAAHVSGGVGKKITAILADGRKVTCEALGLNSESDCAMARITEKGEYPFVEIDREDRSKLGDWVFSLGHSGGYDAARGAGVRIGRLVKLADATVQSDCTLIGGDSGGPLFDLNGRLIGIHSRVGENLQQNMHVPMREFLRHWDAMKERQFIGEGPFANRPKKGSGFLGIGTEDIAGGGLSITQIGRESPAEAAGLQVGDVLKQIDDVLIRDKAGMRTYLKEKAAGEMIRVVIVRAGKEISLTIRLAEKSS